MEKEELVQEKKIHEFLAKLKKEDIETYNKAKKILGFIYRDVKKDFFDIRKRYDYWKESIDYVPVVESAKDNLFKYYINGENTILDLFIKMCNEDNKQYLDIFYNGCETFITMAEEGIYYDYPIFQYVFNMYVMLKAYDVFKDKKESGFNPLHEFKQIVNDFSSFFITSEMKVNKSYSSYSGVANQTFVSKKSIIDSIIEVGKYKEAPEMCVKIQQLLNTIHSPYDDLATKNYKKGIDLLDSFYKTVEKYRYTGRNINSETLKEIEHDLFKFLNEPLYYNSYYGRYEAMYTFSYFTPILIFGDRYHFIKDTLPTVETHTPIIKDVLTHISKMDIDFFEELNKDFNDGQDSFITLMKIAFDSDSYYELASKLNDIIKASKLYKTNKSEALKLVEALPTRKHKEVIDGIMVTYPDNSINKIDKPKTIFKRMIDLHHHIPHCSPEHDYEYLLNPRNHSNITIDKVVSSITQNFAQNKKRAEEALEKERIAREEAEKQPIAEEPKKVKGLGSLFAFGKNNQDK